MINLLTKKKNTKNKVEEKKKHNQAILCMEITQQNTHTIDN